MVDYTDSIRLPETPGLTRLAHPFHRRIEVAYLRRVAFVHYDAIYSKHFICPAGNVFKGGSECIDDCFS